MALKFANELPKPEAIQVGDIGTWSFSTNYGPPRYKRFTVVEKLDKRHFKIKYDAPGENYDTLEYRSRTKKKWFPEWCDTKEFSRCNDIVWYEHIPDPPPEMY